MDDLRDRVSRILIEQFQVAEGRITDMTNLDLDLGATSLDLVEAVMSLEDEFSIEISDEKASRLRTVGDIVACVMAEVRRAVPGLASS